MAVDIGPKIGITGEREFRNQLQQTNQALKTLAAESKAVSSAFDAETDAEKKSAAQKDVLNRQIQTQKDKLILLEKGLQEAAQKFGEADTRTMKWQQAVHEGTAQLNNMERQLTGMDPAIDETTDSMEQAGEATRGWADVMKGQLLADFVKNGLKKIADLTKSIGTAMWDASKAGAAYADDILTLATTTGLSTDELQEYKYMADLVDVSLETLTGSLTKLTSNMAKAKDGEGEAAAVFQELRVSVTDSSGQLRKAKDVFRDTITALGRVKNETERDTKAMTLFGKSAKELNPMIAAGADEMEALAKEAHRTGYVLSGEALTALGKQQDAMERLERKAEALRNNFAAKMAPGITKAYDKIGDAMDNPRVQRGLDLVAEGFGNIIGKAADLAAKVLPDLMAAFSDDVRLRTFSDEELKLAQRIDDAAEEYQNMIDTYKANAETILGETERTRDLWGELETLVEKDGFVVDANKERVDYILHELNDALGTEYELNGNIIKQYETMQTEIVNLIKQREAERLLAAGEEKFTEAYEKRKEALEDAGREYEKIAEKQQAVIDAEKALEDSKDEARSSPGYYYQGEQYVANHTAPYQVDLTYAQRSLKETMDLYEKAKTTAQRYYGTVEKYEKAQSAMLQGNYDLAIRLMADDFGVTLEYYKNKKILNEQEKTELREKIRTQELAIAEYKRNLEAGLAGFSESGLKEMEDYVLEARRILNGQTGKGIGIDFLLGIINGLEDIDAIKKLKEAAKNVGKTVSGGTQWTLQIASPSRLGKWMGQMWDEGLILGLEAKEAELAKAAAGLAGTIATASNPVGIGAYTYGYGNAMTAAGSASTRSYTTNMGGITVRIDGAGAVNEDVLAQRVAVRLTNELQRAQRGGRR